MNQCNETEGALAAMNRAAATARLRALRFGSNLAVWRDDAVVLIPPHANDAEQADTEQPATHPTPDAERRENP